MRRALLAMLLLAAAARADVLTEPRSGLRYEVVLPPGWDGTRSAELVVCLHGSGDAFDAFRKGLRAFAPSIRRSIQAYVQSPDRDGWPRTAADGIALVASAVAAAHPVDGALLLGYSAGGWLAASTLYQHPDVFDGALLVGSIGAEPPPRRLAPRSPLVYWSLGTEDPAVTRNGGFDLAALERHLDAAGWPRDRWTIDALQGKGHELDGPSVDRGLEWLRGRLLATGPPATDADREAAARVAALAAADDAAGLRALAAPVLAGRRREARALLAGALLELPAAKDRAVSLAAIELLGRLRDPRAAPVLAGLLERLSKDEGRQAAAIEALGALGGPEAAAALVKVARRWEHGGRPQVAACAALARCGGKDEVGPLIAELEEAERQARAAHVDALDAALAGISGQALRGSRAWKAWRSAMQKAAR